MIGRLSPEGDLDISRPGLLRGTEYLAQKIKQVLRLVKGEWFLDLNLGVPWFEEILVKGPNLEVVRGIFRTKILEIPGITSVPTLLLQVVRPTRVLIVTFVAKTTAGQNVSGTVEISA